MAAKPRSASCWDADQYTSSGLTPVTAAGWDSQAAAVGVVREIACARSRFEALQVPSVVFAVGRAQVAVAAPALAYLAYQVKQLR